MESTTESIGRLITNEVLLQAERQLLRNGEHKDQPAQEPPSQPPPEPLTHNDKTISSVLMTLLDEQLNAATVDPKQLAAHIAPSDFGAAETPAARLVSAQYAEAEAVFQPDVPAQQMNLAPNPNNPQIFAALSPELRMAMQSAFIPAAIRRQEEAAALAAQIASRTTTSGSAEARMGVRIGAGVFALAVLIIVVAAIVTH
jgi:hypothetical protein